MSPFVDVAFNLPVDRLFTYRSDPEGRALPGRRVVAPFGARSLVGYVIAVRDTASSDGYEMKAVAKVLDENPLFGDEETKLAAWMSSYYFCSFGEALSVMVPGARREREPEEDDGLPPDPERRPATLSDEQEAAVAGILSGGSSQAYVYGVTGSGKTEVFLRAAEAFLSRGKGVIYLVPEISLTHQLVLEARERFGAEVAVIHSGLTPSEKLTQWTRIRRGEARFIAGARSAVFAPVRDLALIVIDEEHDASYKSGSTPRYHARQVAMRRCLDAGARLVMGSATPSVEAWHLMREGTLARLPLTRRLSGGSMPAVEIVDMRRETQVLSHRLLEELRLAKREKRQAILFLNRRGFSYYFHCRSCGFEMKCRNCSVTLTFHKKRGRMVCHYCGYTRAPETVCPDCGSLDVGYSGFGTEKIEEDIKRLLPDFSLRRVDTDAIRKKGSLAAILAEFRKGEIDILLGTQMVAKGLNFPGVKLVGLVQADTGLHLPDFRSVERTFALIVQVAGRAGRHAPDGKVLVQTAQPDAEAIRLAVRGDIEAFYDKELETRRVLGFPPFGRLIRILFRGKDGAAAFKESETFAAILARVFSGAGAVSVLGPAECPLACVSGQFRHHLILRSDKLAALQTGLRQALSGYAPPRTVRMEVDVDPVSLL